MHLIANNIDGMIVMSELTRMRSGETYNCLDEELKLMRAKTAQLVFQFNHEANPDIRRQLLAEMGVQLENSACIEPPLQLTYGCHLSIGENSYINWDAIILPGVTIGDEAVVGAGSVITKDVAPGDRVAGNPARSIKPKN